MLESEECPVHEGRKGGMASKRMSGIVPLLLSIAAELGNGEREALNRSGVVMASHRKTANTNLYL